MRLTTVVLISYRILAYVMQQQVLILRKPKKLLVYKWIELFSEQPIWASFLFAYLTNAFIAGSDKKCRWAIWLTSRIHLN